jgi:hypothetical protein
MAPARKVFEKAVVLRDRPAHCRPGAGQRPFALSISPLNECHFVLGDCHSWFVLSVARTSQSPLQGTLDALPDQDLLIARVCVEQGAGRPAGRSGCVRLEMNNCEKRALTCGHPNLPFEARGVLRFNKSRPLLSLL